MDRETSLYHSHNLKNCSIIAINLDTLTLSCHHTWHIINSMLRQTWWSHWWSSWSKLDLISQLLQSRSSISSRSHCQSRHSTHRARSAASVQGEIKCLTDFTMMDYLRNFQSCQASGSTDDANEQVSLVRRLTQICLLPMENHLKVLNVPQIIFTSLIRQLDMRNRKNLIRNKLATQSRVQYSIDLYTHVT